MKFPGDFPQFVRFKEGEQWPAATDRTKNLPRPVFNIVDMFVRTKRAAVLNQPITINYTPSEISADDITRELAAQGASDLTAYARQLWKRTKQDIINAELVDDAATLGTGIYHCYYDLSVTGGMDKKWRGEIRGETIDPLNFFVSDPQCRDIQKQEWVIISQRLSIEKVQRIAKRYGLSSAQIAQLKEDTGKTDSQYDAEKYEPKDEEKLTLLTKYHRDEAGNVVMTRCTEKVIICEDEPLTPNGATCSITRYPVAVFNWYLRKKSIFGIGEVQTMIPAQKAVNFLKAMELLSIQQTAWPKLILKPGSVNRQAITNEPGEILMDNSPNGVGISYLSPPPMSGAASALAESIMSLMRTTSGVNEATTGESMGASMAASAIIALQSQAKTPIEEIQKRYWLTEEDIGAIWAEFVKCYYTDERALNVDDNTDAGAAPERRVFLGSAYAGIDFDMTIDVGASSEYGEVLSQTTLDKMLDRGDITIDQYVDMAPRNVVPFKEQFKQFREQSGQAAQALMQQAQMMAESGQPLPLPDESQGIAEAPGGSMPTADLRGITRPAGVGGMQLPAIPTAPSIPALKGS